MQISIFIPAYNEEAILAENISRVHASLTEHGYDFELFIVDDGSDDATPEIAEGLSRELPAVKHLRYDDGPSWRENLAKSFQKAGGQMIVFMDADLSADIARIPKLISSVSGGADIATGSRYLSGSKVSRTLYREIISRAFNICIRIIFGSTVTDHECGFKAFKRETLFSLLDEMGYDAGYRRKMFWDSELLVRAQRRGLTVAEIPVHWEAGKKTTQHLVKGLSMIPYMVSLRLRL